MRSGLIYIAVIILIGIVSYFQIKSSIGHEPDTSTISSVDTLVNDSLPLIIKTITDSMPQIAIAKGSLIKPGTGLSLNQIVNFAETLIGTPYRYASTDPAEGFDCSGFITYVFNHFKIKVPRSSVEFTNRGTEVPISHAKRGDLILFTGTDSASSTVGHMGIVTENTDSLRFIHSSSGKANGVTVTVLNGYYLKRFVKVIRIENGL